MTASTPRTRLVRPFTTHILNRFTRLFVHRLPGFAIISYRGRKSGQTYRTPMNVFRDGEAYVFALTYGSDVQWVKNVLAAGSAELQVGYRTISLAEPQLFIDPKRRLMPLPVRLVLGFLRVSEFLRMHPVTWTSFPAPFAERGRRTEQGSVRRFPVQPEAAEVPDDRDQAFGRSDGDREGRRRNTHCSARVIEGVSELP